MSASKVTAVTDSDSAATIVNTASNMNNNINNNSRGSSSISSSAADATNATGTIMPTLSMVNPAAAGRIPPVVRTPECRIMVYCVAKRANIGTIVRSAVAFGVSQIIVIGNRKINCLGCQGTQGYIAFAYYPTLELAVTALKAEHFSIVGMEIGGDATDIVEHKFDGPTCFMMGAEGDGMHPKAKAVCDKLMYIKQVGFGTASLNVAVAASIALHHFATWAKYEANAIEGEKFVVDKRRQVDNHPTYSRKYDHYGDGGDVAADETEAVTEQFGSLFDE